MRLCHTRVVSSAILILTLALVFTCSHAATLPPVLNTLSVPDRSALKQAASTPRTGILVTDDQGQVLFSRNPDTPMVPASILKILTSFAALSQWGAHHRFSSLAGYDPNTRILYLKGHGDPLFVSEVIRDFCGQMASAFDLRNVDKIIVDQGYFAPNITIPGTGRTQNPYDATVGALCANFNTIHFTWDPATRAFVSAELQTPLLDMFRSDISSTGLKQGRILLDAQARPRYPGLLTAYFLKELGVDVSGPVTTGSMPVMKRQVVHTLTSPWTLDQVVEKLLTYSNNFIANQVMLALGAGIFGPPATLEKGILALTKTAGILPGWDTAHIAEGSGISRENRVTPSQMGTLLLAFMPHHRLLSSNGTQYYKTGTLTGIRNRAGYFIGMDGRLYPFVIMGSVPYF
jgi:D-alanyl-D-alanine carboxypeptidase/D-alanyl-D-alanine-endopeptidase (penicillin-binding protein 4)